MDSTRSSVPGVAVTPENAGHRAWLGRQLMAGLPTCVDNTPRTEAAGARVWVGARPGGPDRTGAAAPLGLSIAHIRSQAIPEHERGKWFADVVYERRRKRLQNDVRQRAEEIERGNALLGCVEWYEGGTLIRLKRPGVYQASDGNFRGKVKGFSRSSRSRLLRFIASLDRRTCGLPIFCTLTYPGDWPGDPTRWKRDLKTWLDRLRRQYPAAWAVWKLEPQKRGAPHYHLLIFGVDRIPKDWIAATWYEVVGSGDPRHLRAGTRIESIRSWGGVMSYAAKYCGKVIDDLPDAWREGVGRWWGVHNSKEAHAHRHRRTAKLHRKAWFKLRRVLLGILNRTGHRFRAWGENGVTVMASIESLPRLLR